MTIVVEVVSGVSVVVFESLHRVGLGLGLFAKIMPDFVLRKEPVSGYNYLLLLSEILTKRQYVWKLCPLGHMLALG